YTYLTEIQETDQSQWQAVWRTDKGVGTQMWAFNPAGTQTIATRAPYNPASQTMSLVLRRAHATAAIFASVVTTCPAESALRTVNGPPRASSLTLAVRGAEIDDTWDIAYTPADQAQGRASSYRYLFGD